MILPSLLPLAFFSLVTATLVPNTELSASNSGLMEQRMYPYGTYINHCDVPGTVALTFDDGPYIYTEELLDLLDAYGAKATFFMNGHNLETNHRLLQRIVNEGHQLASHTWGHPNLPVLSRDQIIQQMTLLESAFESIVGVVPTYMRPPYLSVSDYVLGVMADLGYHVIGASVDTKDYENDHPDLIGRSVEKFNLELDQGGTIILAHDIHEQTVHTLTHIMLDEIVQRGLQRKSLFCLFVPVSTSGGFAN
ncbi:chitin deacetylase [Aspergillus lucknowensis]|uniref:NodB homology domain-containing protein n=1 Tax=Aspergillus lucknowensis TaxID=176173 RepID=A0ABR4M0S3_9EURO